MRAKEFITEAPDGYKEIEFVCVNPQFPDATDPALQKKMYRGLKQIDGVVPLWQEWGDYSEGQASLSAIYQDSMSRDKILSLAKQLGVKVDLEQAVSDDYVDRAMRGEHEGQRGLAEGQNNLSYIGNCTDDDVIEHVFGDATGFAQAVEEYGDEFVLDDLVVKYDPETDVHSFYYQQQGVAEEIFVSEDAVMGKIEDGGKIVRILKKQHTVPFSDEKNWLLIDTDPAKGNKGLGLKWVPASTRFTWVRPYRDSIDENFADGRNPQDKGDSKRHGINTKASVSSLRKTAKQGGRKGQLAHWLANMKSGRAKKK
jgi:uncharacterized protein YuzE